MDIKAALVEARRSQEAQFAKDWQDRLKQLKAEEVRVARLLSWSVCAKPWTLKP